MVLLGASYPCVSRQIGRGHGDVFQIHLTPVPRSFSRDNEGTCTFHNQLLEVRYLAYRIKVRTIPKPISLYQVDLARKAKPSDGEAAEGSFR